MLTLRSISHTARSTGSRPFHPRSRLSSPGMTANSASTTPAWGLDHARFLQPGIAVVAPPWAPRPRSARRSPVSRSRGWPATAKRGRAPRRLAEQLGPRTAKSRVAKPPRAPQRLAPRTTSMRLVRGPADACLLARKAEAFPGMVRPGQRSRLLGHVELTGATGAEPGPDPLRPTGRHAQGQARPSGSARSGARFSPWRRRVRITDRAAG